MGSMNVKLRQWIGSGAAATAVLVLALLGGCSGDDDDEAQNSQAGDSAAGGNAGGSSGTKSANSAGSSAGGSGNAVGGGSGGTRGLPPFDRNMPVAKCPGTATCAALIDEFICIEGFRPPACTKQSDCKWGHCMVLSLGGTCVLPCAGETAPKVTVNGGVVEFERGKGFVSGAEKVLAGVKVCVHGMSDVPCVTTDAMGLYLLKDLPSGKHFTLTYEKEGYQSAAIDKKPAVSNVNLFEPHLRMSKLEIARENAEKIGFKPDPTKGSMSFGVYEENKMGIRSPFSFQVGGGIADFIFVRGYTVDIEPKAGVGPVYFGPDESPDMSLKESSDAGWGLFVDLAPGIYTINFHVPGYDCTPLEVPVLANHVTSRVGGRCFTKGQPKEWWETSP